VDVQDATEGRWLIVDDDELACRAIHRTLGFDQRATIARSGGEARAALGEDVRWIGLFLDLRLGDDNGIDVLAWARARDVLAPATLLTGEQPNRELLNRTFCLGGAFLCKPVSSSDLSGFVARCLAEHHAIRPSVRIVIEQLARAHSLSRREMELLVRVVAGATLDEARSAMGISKSTWKTHTGSLLEKVGTRDLKEVTIGVLRAALEL
jgi:DNA-binding NarL/FixJ family response regulator